MARTTASVAPTKDASRRSVVSCCVIVTIHTEKKY
jgi:hypothetical protein